MTPKFIFYILISILVINFILESILDCLNSKHFNNPIPDELNDVYNKDEYLKSQAYKKENAKFGFYSSLFSIITTITFFLIKGFAFVDNFARQFSENEIVITLLFFGIILFASNIITLPFDYYHTFYIEEKYGFNKMDKKTFWLDKLKSGLLSIIIGGVLLSVIMWSYQKTGNDFWIYATLIVAFFSIFMTLFYSSLIVPLFNKQTPLSEGELKNAISEFAKKTDFKIDNIYVIDGSKRSTKANAYFSGFGNKKRIVLYDTLINDLNTNEIIAVLAHEIGHYKKRHILINMIISIFFTGFTLYLLSLMVDNKILAEALSVKKTSFHIGLIVFGVLYTPISVLTNLIMNWISRKFEYQADNFAKFHFDAKYLISGLKKLSKNSLSNLTPHKSYVLFNYSHPPLLQRIKNLLS
jgi:STE24 endopeptidase